MELTVKQLKEAIEDLNDDAIVKVKVGYDLASRVEVVTKGSDGYHFERQVILKGNDY